MSRVLRKDIETKNLRKTIIKFSKDIPAVGERHRGVFSITGYRVYDITSNTNYVEIEMVFNGEILVSVSQLKGSEWLDSDILKSDKYRISKVRLNKFLKNRLFNEVNNHLSYFDAKINGLYEIKKIKWI